MSRVGLKPVSLPNGVEVSFRDGVCFCSGKLGNLQFQIPACIVCRLDVDCVIVTLAEKESEDKRLLALWGMTRQRISSMVQGVSEGYATTVVLSGVGYKVEEVSSYLVFSLGFSHDIAVILPQGVKFKIGTSEVTFFSHDKELLTNFVAVVCSLRAVEAYKGKGLFIKGSRILRKEAKKKK